MTIFNSDEERNVFTERLGESSRFNRFAYDLQSLEDLDPNVRAQVDKIVDHDETPERIIVAPPQRGLFKDIKGIRRFFSSTKWRLSPEWVLIVTPKRMILVSITGAGEHLNVSATPIHEILYMELGAILLYSWSKWIWLENNQIRTEAIYYNTVSERIFLETKDYLSSLLNHNPVKLDADNQADLDSLPYKFRRIIRERLLMQEERVVAAVFRSPEWTTRYGLIKKQTVPAASLVMTNYHLLFVQEEHNSSSDKYSFIARYWPISLVSSPKLNAKENGVDISFLVIRGDFKQEIAISFSTSMKHQLLNWIDRFKGANT
jgi:hypothetical protein